MPQRYLTAEFGFLLFSVIVTVGNAALRRALALALAVPIITIGVPQIYDGAHWPSNVLGGYVIGSIWLALTIGLYVTLTRRFRGPGHEQAAPA